MSANLTEQIVTRIAALKKLCGSFGKKPEKEAINRAQKHIQDAKSKSQHVDLAILMEPFFQAANSKDHVKYWPVIIDCFSALFVLSASDGHFLPPDLQEKVLKTIFGLIQVHVSDEVKIHSVDAVSSCLSSASGKCYVHGSLLHQCLIHMVSMFNQVESGRKKIEPVILNVLNYVVQKYPHPVPMPKFDTVEKMSRYLVAMFIRNSLAIQEYAGGRKKATIQDVDMIILISVFARTITMTDCALATTTMCAHMLLKVLMSKSPFFNTKSFANLLRKQVHVALLSLALDTKQQTADVTAKLIKVVWNRFALFYNEGLNEVLDKGIATALDSPYADVLMRSFKIFKYLIAEPQFLVDCFVNYDCDPYGLFKNIFENTVNAIVKKAYPGQPLVSQQKRALKTLLVLLGSLWDYFQKFGQENTTRRKEEAKFVLDMKKAKMTLEAAMELFKQNPGKGLLCFSANKLCDDTPQAYADFLFDTPSLDPAGVGEIIGGSKPLNLQILPLFVNRFNFKGLTFEQGFRQFLSKFHIPGESQMIDRIMEQFGKKFYNDNPELFSCPDTVYVLSFSTLMLHTDAHHPNVKKHMTLEEFIRNNRGIDRGKDLPAEFLEQLYKGITSEKIFAANAAMPSQALLTRQQRAELYRQQCAQTLEMAKKRTTTELHQHRFHRARSPFLVGPMFRAIWGGTIAAFAMSFESTDDQEIIDFCLKGFQLSTHIASHCYVEDALSTLVDSFAKFTRLESNLIQETLKPKNFACTNALINCAFEDRNVLKGAWLIVLREISALDKIRSNKNFVIDMTSSEKVFTHLETLDRESIVDFVTAMCKVSADELAEKPPRRTMLTYLQEVCIWNMDRPMYIWKDIWNVVGAHLSSQCCLSSDIMASNTVNNIKQMAYIFLKKEEREQFHFQQQFLQPFSNIFDSQNSFDVKDLILSITSQIVSTMASALHSGWTVILQILQATVTEEALTGKGFMIIEMVVTEFLQSVKPFFEHLVSVLAAFVMSGHHGKIAVRAVANFSIAASCLTRDDERYWEVLLPVLTKCCHHPRFEVMQAAEDNLFLIVMNYGCAQGGFTEAIWDIFFTKCLFSLMSYKETTSERIFWHRGDVLNEFLTKIYEPNKEKFTKYLKTILSLFSYCCQSSNEKFRSDALKCLARFVTVSLDMFESSEVEALLGVLKECIVPMSNSVLFVDTVAGFVTLLMSQPDVTSQLLDVLAQLVTECSTKRRDDMIPCWCAARKEYLRCAIMKGGMDDIVCSHFMGSLNIYFELIESEADLTYWDDLIIAILAQVSALGDDLFAKCVDKSIELICDLVEVRSEPVREELMKLLQRRLVTSHYE